MAEYKLITFHNDKVFTLLSPRSHLYTYTYALKKKERKKKPEYSLEGLMLKLQYFGHLTERVNSLEKILMLGKIEGKR